MDFRRTHDMLTSLAVSAMLTSAVLSTAPGAFVAAGAGPQPQALVNAIAAMRAADWSGAASLSTPAPVTAPHAAAPQNITKAAPTSAPILSETQLQKMMQLDAQLGHDTPMLTEVTRTLGLTTGDQVMTLREIQYTDDNNPNDPPHIFAPLPNGEFLFFRATTVGASLFRVDKDLNLITAVFHPINQPVAAMPISLAQQMLREELQAWSTGIGPVTIAASK